MSFWFSGKKHHGRRPMYSVSVPLMGIIAFVGFLFALLLPFLQSCRDASQRLH